MKRLARFGFWAILGAAGVALADAPDAATVARLQGERTSLVRLLDEIPADQLTTDPELKRLAKMVVRIDQQLSGGNDDPLLSNEAIQASRVREMQVKLLADRAQRSKTAEASARQKLGTEVRDKEVLAKVAATAAEGDEALADAAAKPAEAEAHYALAIAKYESAAQQLKALLPPPPPPVVIDRPPPPPVDPLADVARADRFLLPTDEQLRALAGPLSRQPVKVAMTVTAMSRPFAEDGTTEFETADGKVHATMSWKQAPPEVRRLFAQRSSGKNAMQVGTKLWVYGAFEGLDAPQHARILVERVDRR